MTNHKKTKHNYNIEGEKKGRGRPRKNVKEKILKFFLKFKNLKLFKFQIYIFLFFIRNLVPLKRTLKKISKIFSKKI